MTACATCPPPPDARLSEPAPPAIIEPVSGKSSERVKPVVLNDGETQLVHAMREGAEDAYESLVRDYGGRMYSVVRRILNNEEDARDALQEAFLQAFRSIDRFSGQSKLSTWLHRIAVNAALMKVRRAQRHKEVSIDDLLPRFRSDGHLLEPGPVWSRTADEDLQAEETRRLVRDQINRLPEDYRTVLLLRDIEGLDTHQAAEALGVSVGAVRTRLHRARQALRTLLDPYMRGASSP